MRISDWSSDVCSSDLWVPIAKFARHIDVDGNTREFLKPVFCHQSRIIAGAAGHDSHAPDIRQVEIHIRQRHLIFQRTEIALQRLRHHHRLLENLRSEEHTSELQSLMRTSYADICLKKKTSNHNKQ